jgi:hypothetical protein
MPQRRVWTEDELTRLREMRQARATWDEISRALGISRNAAITKAGEIGAKIGRRRPEPPPPPDLRPPHPPGHPASWSLITRGTALDGVRYPPWSGQS